MGAVEKSLQEQLNKSFVTIMTALMPVVEKFAAKMSEPTVVNALVVGVEAVLDKFVREIEKIPAIIEQDKEDELNHMAEKKRKEEFLAWLGKDEERLNSLPAEQIEALKIELVCYQDFEKGKPRWKFYDGDVDPWNIPNKEKQG